jgi:YaiO family outer membrane protein
MKRALALLLLASGAAPAAAAELELAYTEEFLTNGYANWRTLGLGAAWPVGERTSIGAAVRELQRFDLNDVDLGASASGPLGERLVLGGEAAASPTHRFMPVASAAAQLQVDAGAGFVASTGVRWSRYVSEAASSNPVILRLGLEQYWGPFRASWTGFLTTVAGAWSASQRASLDFFYGERGRVGVGLNMGRELESVAGGVLVVTDVLGAVVAGRQDVDAHWSFVWEVGAQRQGQLYTRTGARLGIRRRF